MTLLTMIIISAPFGIWSFYAFWTYEGNGYLFPYEHPGFFFFVLLYSSTSAFIIWKIPKDIYSKLSNFSLDYSLTACLLNGLGAVILVITASMTPYQEFGNNHGFILSFLYALLIWLPLHVALLPTIIIEPFLIGAATIFSLPHVLLGLRVMFHTTESMKIARTQADSTVSDPTAEKRLAKALKGELEADSDIASQIQDLSPPQRVVHTLLNKIRGKKQAEINELLKAQEEKIREQVNVARSVHSLERTKRGHHDE